MATAAKMKIYNGTEWVELDFGSSSSIYGYYNDVKYISNIESSNNVRSSTLSFSGPNKSGVTIGLKSVNIPGYTRRLVSNYWGDTTTGSLVSYRCFLVKIVGYGTRETYHYIPNLFGDTDTTIVLAGPYSSYTATVKFCKMPGSGVFGITTSRSNSTYVTGIYIYGVE